jgi:hypothetical protein
MIHNANGYGNVRVRFDELVDTRLASNDRNDVNIGDAPLTTVEQERLDEHSTQRQA